MSTRETMSAEELRDYIADNVYGLTYDQSPTEIKEYVDMEIATPGSVKGLYFPGEAPEGNVTLGSDCGYQP